jgi:hypothetical protein
MPQMFVVSHTLPRVEGARSGSGRLGTRRLSRVFACSIQAQSVTLSSFGARENANARAWPAPRP